MWAQQLAQRPCSIQNKTKTIKLQEITLWRKAELNESRIPTSQFISNQLPNGNFKTQQTPEIKNTAAANTTAGSGDATENGATTTEEPPEEAF